MTDLDDRPKSAMIRMGGSSTWVSVQHICFILTGMIAAAAGDRADAVKSACSLATSLSSNGVFYVVALGVVGMVLGAIAAILTLREKLNKIYLILSVIFMGWITWSFFTIFSVATNSATCHMIPSS